MKNRLLKFSLVIATLGITNILVLAHEFWLAPKKFRVALQEAVAVDFLVGENFEGSPWGLKPERIKKLELHSSNQVISLAPEITSQNPNLAVKFDTQGTKLIFFESQDSFIELDGEKFNAYLKEDGLDETLQHRTKTNTLQQPAKEFYSRVSKVLLQCGSETNDTHKKVVGARLEIVPDQNPYTLKTGGYLQCRLIFEGKPAAHQLVKVWNKVNGTTFLQNIYTEKDGTLRFPINARGQWMISAVKMIPSEKPEADWRSMWASLTFGIE